MCMIACVFMIVLVCMSVCTVTVVVLTCSSVGFVAQRSRPSVVAETTVRHAPARHHTSLKQHVHANIHHSNNTYTPPPHITQTTHTRHHTHYTRTTHLSRTHRNERFLSSDKRSTNQPHLTLTTTTTPLTLTTLTHLVAGEGDEILVFVGPRPPHLFPLLERLLRQPITSINTTGQSRGIHTQGVAYKPRVTYTPRGCTRYRSFARCFTSCGMRAPAMRARVACACVVGVR